MQYEAKIELRRKNEQLKILHSISLAILSAQSPSEIARIALRDIQKFTECHIATINLFDLKNKTGRVLRLEGADKLLRNTFPLTQWG